jgi:DNA primase
LDLIRCYTNGVRNVVAPQGTALTTEHARILKRYVEEVVLCFDADEAGRNAAERSFESLADAGLAVRVAQVPAPHDPDSFIREQGGEAFQKIIASAVGYFDFLLERVGTENDPTTDRGRIAVVKAISEALTHARNQVLTDTYVRKTALRLGVSPEAVKAEMRKSQQSTRPRSEREDSDAAPDGDDEVVSRPDALEIWLLRLLLRHDEQLEWFTHHLDPQWLEHPLTRELVEARLSLQQEPATAMITQLPHEAARSLASELLTEDQQLPETVRQAGDIVTRLRNRHLDREIARLMSRAGASALGNDEQIQLLREVEVLRRLKREPLGALPDA